MPARTPDDVRTTAAAWLTASQADIAAIDEMLRLVAGRTEQWAAMGDFGAEAAEAWRRLAALLGNTRAVQVAAIAKLKAAIATSSTPRDFV